MQKSLVIVESPAKARTIAGFLGDGFIVESSIGHIRDLPRNASEIPSKYNREPWSRLGVNVDNGFQALYVTSPEKRAQVTKLKTLLEKADRLLLATDEDREGESIAWHLVQVLAPKVPIKRMVFHEITPEAIERALKNPRDIDTQLVNAQEARRILDRLYGYEVSPVLWKKVLPRLSAGRVQSVATRMIVERERARMRFRSASFWDLEVVLQANGGSKTPPFATALVSLDGTRLAQGKDYGEDGKLNRSNVLAMDGAQAKLTAQSMKGGTATVRKVERKAYQRSPAPPFMTSTLQQEAGRKLRFSAARTMQAAQRLYESGFITYMRTDSVALSDVAVRSAREHIRTLFGDAFLPPKPRKFYNKVKNAQEAHEAIRPAGEVFQRPEDVAQIVGSDEAKLYELIWMRAVASQMADARGERVQMQIEAFADGKKAELAVSGNTITFPGFLRAYVEGNDDPEDSLANMEKPLPELHGGEQLIIESATPRRHETLAPARFTEASLVRDLEAKAVGRPSTFASILATIQDRGYVWKKGTALVPSFVAFSVVALLEQHFPVLVDYEFTARMEDDLDAIAHGTQEMVPWLGKFYFGNQSAGLTASAHQDLAVGLRALVSDNLGEIDARAINSLPIGEGPDGLPIMVRVGRYGPYLAYGDATASIPEDLPPDELTVEKALSLIEVAASERKLGTDPDTGLDVWLRMGRFGAYVQLGETDSEEGKPKRASLFRSMSPDTVTLEQALSLLRLPRIIGVSEGESLEAHHGRYGPYILKGKERRSLETEEQIFTISLSEALALLAQPNRRVRTTASGPLRELGDDPVSGGKITVREGRFGPYVTDGQTNASLRKGDTIDGITLERAAELLVLRREKLATNPKKPRKQGVGPTASKKATAKKAAKKKVSAKKSPTKKAAAKKATAKKTTTKSASAKKTATLKSPTTKA